MSAFLSSFAAALGAAMQPFADIYAASVPLQTGTSFLHFAGLLTGGGFAIASDRMLLRAARLSDTGEQRAVLTELDSVHKPVLAGLSIVFLTGLLLTAADVETFITSVPFWVKMGLIALLLANGWWLGHNATMMRRRPDRGQRYWRLLLVNSVVSLALWLGVTLAGVILTSA